MAEDVEDSKPDDEKSPSEGPLIYAHEEIFKGRKEVFIELNEEMYRLRITSKGKLHLSK